MKNQSNQVKERPIIFSGEMVKAILDGKKTMTRRVVKTQPDFNARYDGVDDDTNHFWEVLDAQGEPTEKYIPILKCPYGKVGDRLWVRETWQEIGPDCLLTYKATYPSDLYAKRPELENVPPLASLKDRGYLWKSPMFMPRWASRILLEITDIRIERLQDISEQDCEKEGFRFYPLSRICFKPSSAKHLSGHGSNNYKSIFGEYWDTLNAKKGYPWSSNPWVWVVEFKVVEVA